MFALNILQCIKLACLFVSGFTEGNENKRSLQDFICLFLILFWSKSKELEGRVSAIFPCITPVVESFFSGLLRTVINYWAELYLEPCLVKHPQRSFSVKIANGLSTLTIFSKIFQRRCLTGLLNTPPI